MSLRIIKPENLEGSQRERIILYGRAGIGKTRAALSLTKRFGKIAYYAADDNSEFLTSIDYKKRDRCVIIKPEGTDPVYNFMEFAMKDWSKVDPQIETLVVDTYTQVANECIRYSANTGSVTSEKHYVVGDPKNGGQTIPNRGDYMAIEAISRGFLDMLFDKQKDKHIIFVCHEDVKLVENIHAVGGPAHPGRTMTEVLPASFNTVIRLVRETILPPGKTVPIDVVVAITENDGKFIAKLRTAKEDGPNPLSKFILDRTAENLWVKYDELLLKENVNV